MSKKVLNEFSLVPNMGIKPSFSSKPSMSVTDGDPMAIAKKAQSLTDQIKMLTTKIATDKDKARKSSVPDQQRIAQYTAQLQQLQSQLAQTSEEGNEENVVPKILKTVGRLGGAAIGGATRIPGAAKLGAKLGEYEVTKMAKFLGIEDEEATLTKKIKKKDTVEINNSKMASTNKKTNVKESLAGTIGDVAGGAVKAAGTVASGIPIIGGAIKAGADLAADGVKGVLGSNENEESNNRELSDIQTGILKTLEKRKYRVNRISYQFADEEGGPTVYLSKKPNHYTTLYAEIDPHGNVNGETLEDFLNHGEENEEKALSRSQQKIAKAAPPYDKITGADFATLKAQKESTEILNFLKAISQKNYSQADKYLGSLVNEKIKNTINKAIDNTK